MSSEDVEQEGERSKRQQHCTYCKNHGQHSRKTSHKCQYEACQCLLCQLTRLSRLVMRHQQRLWRHLKDERWREDAADHLVLSSKLQKCDMCRNHGVLKEKRAHKNTCPYQDCPCHLCDLTRKRRDIMRHQQRVRRSQVTSQHREEASDYVVQTTAELAHLAMDGDPATTTPSAPTSSTTCSSSSVMAKCTAQTSATTLSPTCSSNLTRYSAKSSDGSTDAGRVVPPITCPPPLELLEESAGGMHVERPPYPGLVSHLESRLHYEAPSTSQGVGAFHRVDSGPAWRNLKRVSTEAEGRSLRPLTDKSVLRNFDFVNKSDTSESGSRWQEVAPALAAPTKKTRFTTLNEDLRPQYSQRCWCSLASYQNRTCGAVPEVEPRAMGVNAQLRPPPALIPLFQTLPVRPYPVRASTLATTGEREPHNLSYSVLHSCNQSSTMPKSPYGQG